MASTPAANTAPPTVSAAGPKKSTTMLVLIVVIVLVGAGLGGLFYYWYQPGNFLNPYRISVSQLNWTENGQTVNTQRGFTLGAGTYVATSLTLVCSQVGGVSQTCSTGNVTIPTPGFTLVSSTTPHTWSSGSTGVSYAVVVQFQCPRGQSYSGYLEIALTGTSANLT